MVLTSTDDGFNRDARSVNFSRKIFDCLVWILVRVRVDVRPLRAQVREQRRGHCRFFTKNYFTNYIQTKKKKICNEALIN
jgi:hypothetical protein